MNKRGTKILIGCILCTMIVMFLFLIVFRFIQLSCELVSLDPVQLASFSHERTKPIMSHDGTILMKISAYLEYNIQPDVSETPPPPIQSLSGNRPMAAGNTGGPFTRAQSDLDWSSTQVRNNLMVSGTNNPLVPPSTASNMNNNKNSPLGHSQPQGPQPSAPQMSLTNQQHNGSAGAFPHNQSSHFDGQFFSQDQQQQTKTEKRFLPLELKSIETRNFADGRHKYILKFNCTTINMFMVHQDNRVYVDKMELELRPASRQETTCEVQLPPSGEFTVADSTQLQRNQPQPPVSSGLTQTITVGSGQLQHASTGQLMSGGASGSGSFAVNATANNVGGNGGKHNNGGSSTKDYPHFAHYYCNKPLRYSCYHYNSKSGPSQSNGILLAELHINGIEFETSTYWQGKHKKVKSDFKSARSECNI